MQAVDQYVLRVLADRWATPSRTPSLLDVSRRGNGVGEELARAGFRVTRITLADSSLETVSERLAGLHRHYDAVVLRDVLDRLEDWQDVVGRAARRLKPGGVLVFGVSRQRTRLGLGRLVSAWLRLRPAATAAEVAASLHRIGLEPREVIPLGPVRVGARSTAYVGHSIMRAERPAADGGMRWDFTGTAERWIAGMR
jgi:SAM-dependent methyltransferase